MASFISDNLIVYGGAKKIRLQLLDDDDGVTAYLEQEVVNIYPGLKITFELPDFDQPNTEEVEEE